jgi:hypothetical protein
MVYGSLLLHVSRRPVLPAPSVVEGFKHLTYGGMAPPP